MLSLGSGLLASCGRNSSSSASQDSSSSSESASSSIADNVISSIRVKAGSLTLEAAQHTTIVDSKAFANLVIEALNKSGEKIGEISYAQASSKFTHTTIDTGVVGKFNFTLSYTVSGSTYSVTVPYTITVDTPASWTSNKEYATWKDVNSNVSDAKKITTANPYPFMKASKFYVGNQNIANLLPNVIPVDDDLSVATIDTMSATDVSVKLADSTGTAVALENVLAKSDEIATKGNFQFKDTITGDYKMTFMFADGTETDFPTITYDITVVNAYNIYNVKDFFVLNNDDIDGNSGEGGAVFDGNDSKIKDWKTKKGIPTDIHASAGVFHTDIVIGKDDIPDNYIWDATRDGSVAALDGSLKDFAYLAKHTFLTGATGNDATFNVYGNFHQVSLAEDFPFITLNGNKGIPAPDGKMVEGHATIFGLAIQASDVAGAEKALRNTYTGNIQDLKVLGNQGVSTNSDGLETGVIFFKGFNDSTISNCVATKFYNAVVFGDSNHVNGAQSTLTINNTRMNNTFCSSLFNWNSAKIVINNSEILNAGGPLVFNQSNHDWNYTNYSNLAGELTNPTPVPAVLEVDANSLLENWVAGAGGWFKQYSAENAVGTLKTSNQLVIAATSNKTSFLDNGFAAPTDTGNGKINLIGLTMANGASITASDGAIFATVKIGNKMVQDYDGGRVACMGKLASSDPSGIYTTQFGALSFLDTMYGSSGQAMVFANSDATHFGTLTADPALVSLDSVVIKGMGGTPSSTALDSSFQTTDILSLYMLGGHQGTDFKATNPYANYVGSNSFGLLLGTAHNS